MRLEDIQGELEWAEMQRDLPPPSILARDHQGLCKNYSDRAVRMEADALREERKRMDERRQRRRRS